MGHCQRFSGAMRAKNLGKLRADLEREATLILENISNGHI